MKMIIFDMDNTLCESCRTISNSMIDMLSHLSQKYEIAVIAGSSIEHIVEQVGPRVHWLLSNSGTRLYDVYDLKTPTYSSDLTIEENNTIYDALKQVMEEFNIPKCEEQIQDRGSQITWSVIGRYAPFADKEAYDPDKKKRKVFRAKLKKYLGSKFEITIGGTTSIDITRKGNNKGEGIRRFAKWRVVQLSDIIFIGDGLFPGGNDESVKGVVKCISVKNPKETEEWLSWLL